LLGDGSAHFRAGARIRVDGGADRIAGLERRALRRRPARRPLSA
jgi:hypothetical protein